MIIRCLQHHAFLVYVQDHRSEWTQLDPYLLRLLVPRETLHCIEALQKRIRRFLAAKLYRRMELEKLFEHENCIQIILAPKNTLVYSPFHGARTLRAGDHLIIPLLGLAYHHGIFLGDDENGVPKVADFSSPSGDAVMRDGKIRIYDLEEFMEGIKWIGVAAYSHDSSEIRIRTVGIARAFAALTDKVVHRYNLLTWNCECFAMLCKTGDFKARSEQVHRVLEIMERHLPYVVAGAALAIGEQSSASSCRLM